ncbi:MAG: hypothetical protein SFX72_06270 [Isosphaeraceae bacterium]|nr:hypothetical protein [Isosphaeraceae bacterium]
MRPGELRYTISGGIALLGVICLVILVGFAQSTRSLIGPLLGVSLFLGLAVTAMNALTEGLVGRSCPECGDSRLRRVAVQKLRHRWYRCDGCGGRWKRTPIGIWEPADDAADDAVYEAKNVVDPWTKDVAVESEPLAWSETHSTLLRSKRTRNPNAPKQGQAPPE